MTGADRHSSSAAPAPPRMQPSSARPTGPSMIRRFFARLIPGQGPAKTRASMGPTRTRSASARSRAARKTSSASCSKPASRPSSSAAPCAICCSGSRRRTSTSRPTRRRNRSSRCSGAPSSSAAAFGWSTCSRAPETIEVSTFRARQTGDDAADEHGRLLSDNVFGSQARRRAAPRFHHQRALLRSGHRGSLGLCRRRRRRQGAAHAADRRPGHALSRRPGAHAARRAPRGQARHRPSKRRPPRRSPSWRRCCTTFRRRACSTKWKSCCCRATRWNR